MLTLTEMSANLQLDTIDDKKVTLEIKALDNSQRWIRTAATDDYFQLKNSNEDRKVLTLGSDGTLKVETASASNDGRFIMMLSSFHSYYSKNKNLSLSPGNGSFQLSHEKSGIDRA